MKYDNLQPPHPLWGRRVVRAYERAVDEVAFDEPARYESDQLGMHVVILPPWPPAEAACEGQRCLSADYFERQKR